MTGTRRYPTKWAILRVQMTLRDKRFQVALGGLAFLELAVRYLYVSVLDSSILSADLRSVWRPFMQSVVHDNVPMYVHPALDNKPPLFEYLNVLAGLTGEYIAAWHLFIVPC
ncbi:hypothetical protein [Halobaculum sp. P14]|uniref:hypothetical protein n=1 Tax=Halobaculum sp. P14 TaxID=3421638 RepID=UPI003EBDD347